MTAPESGDTAIKSGDTAITTTAATTNPAGFPRPKPRIPGMIPHPEYKRLLESIKPLLDGGKTEFGYEELEKLAGVDIRSVRGRNQWQRFRWKALDAWGVWFEFATGKGYYVAPIGEHPACAKGRIRRGERQVRKGGAIAAKTINPPDTPPDIVRMKCQIAASAGVILQVARAEKRKQRELSLAESAKPQAQMSSAEESLRAIKEGLKNRT